MCGIAGYLGPRNAVRTVFEQLKLLEYRGYDSAGIAYLQDGDIRIVKRAGKLSELGKAVEEEMPEASLAIAHSRWATHGGPTDENAHPHYDQFQQVAIIHNGIIENYQALKEQMIAEGHTFRSQTDTEVVAHLVGKYYRGDLAQAVRDALKEVEGAYAIGVVCDQEPDVLVAARCGSPLIVGLGEGENFIASDVPAILNHTRRIIY
ncbi:MAG TPA: glutamine--fructose-6-phosphate aminotransferase, partial [Armatimonadetes bacterium]|nr:glutamine--fructose-6-phosphate aminotransferase [Armatimonadota bacterium]